MSDSACCCIAECVNTVDLGWWAHHSHRGWVTTNVRGDCRLRRLGFEILRGSMTIRLYDHLHTCKTVHRPYISKITLVSNLLYSTHAYNVHVHVQSLCTIHNYTCTCAYNVHVYTKMKHWMQCTCTLTIIWKLGHLKCAVRPPLGLPVEKYWCLGDKEQWQYKPTDRHAAAQLLADE